MFSPAVLVRSCMDTMILYGQPNLHGHSVSVCLTLNYSSSIGSHAYKKSDIKIVTVIIMICRCHYNAITMKHYCAKASAR